jgi:hypothetical protein
VQLEDLVIGRKYLIKHKSESQRRLRESVLTFLGLDGSGCLQWDAQPSFGTQSLPKEWIIDIVEVDQAEKHRVGKVLADTPIYDQLVKEQRKPID